MVVQDLGSIASEAYDKGTRYPLLFLLVADTLQVLIRS
jgi:hypothetical protein